MTTIRQLIHSSPKKANDLFAKLVDTSDTAVKTRDRLFSELKNEIELQAELEEQHLFPVLKKHKETKGLVADALSDNRQTRKLLAELESTPKDSEAFGVKVSELQKAFQQHVRDEKKEFLPAVVKALSDEEASSVVEKIEDEKAQVEAAQRAEADEHRAEAKREREQTAAKREREEAAAKREREEAAEANAAKDKAKADAERVQKTTVAAQAGASTVARKNDDKNEQSEAARRSEADRKMAGSESQVADIVEAGAKVAQQGAKVMPMATRAGADGAKEMGKAVRAATGSEETQQAGRQTDTASAMVALFSEQAQHAMLATVAVGRARTAAEVSAVSATMGGTTPSGGTLPAGGAGAARERRQPSYR